MTGMKRRRRYVLPVRQPPPRTQEWPRAFTLLTESRKIMSKALTGMAFGALGCVMFWPVGLPVFLFCLTVCMALTILRVFLIATYFSRYSLAHLMGVYVSVSFLVSLIMVCHDSYKLFPIFALFCVFCTVSAFILAQDPQGDNFMPPFVREKMIERRRMLRDKVKQTAESAAQLVSK
jgi:hypothetical protein